MKRVSVLPAYDHTESLIVNTLVYKRVNEYASATCKYMALQGKAYSSLRWLQNTKCQNVFEILNSGWRLVLFSHRWKEPAIPCKRNSLTKLTLLKYWPWKTSSAAQSSAMALKQPVGQKRLTNVAVVRALAGRKGWRVPVGDMCGSCVIFPPFSGCCEHFEQVHCTSMRILYNKTN